MKTFPDPGFKALIEKIKAERKEESVSITVAQMGFQVSASLVEINAWAKKNGYEEFSDKRLLHEVRNRPGREYFSNASFVLRRKK